VRDLRYLRRLAQCAAAGAGHFDPLAELPDFLPRGARAGMVALDAQRAGGVPPAPPVPDLVLRVVAAGESLLVASKGARMYRDAALDAYLVGAELYLTPVAVGGRAVAAVWVVAETIDTETRATADEAALAIALRLSLSGPDDSVRRSERVTRRVYALAAEAKTREALAEAARAHALRCDLVGVEQTERPSRCACPHHASATVAAAGHALGRLLVHSNRPIVSSTVDELVVIAQIGMLAERIQARPPLPAVSTLAELTTFSDPPWLSVGSLDRSELVPPLAALLVERRDFEHRQALERVLIAAVSAALGPAAVRSPMATRTGQVLTLLPRHDASATRRVAQRVTAEARQRGIAAVCFVSTPGTSADVQRLIAEAERLAALGRHLRPPDSVVDAGAVGLYAVLLETADPRRLAEWADRLLGPLVAYDEAHGATLVTTLEAYLQEWGHLAACAARIFIHPNTLKYRLRRIQEILEVDLRDPLVRADLLFACYARRTTLALAGAPTDAAPVPGVRYEAAR
jgi:hypothetical protein